MGFCEGSALLKSQPGNVTPPGALVESWLRARGLKVGTHATRESRAGSAAPKDGLLCSSLCADRLTRFYQLMRRYSFRLLMREIIETRGRFQLEDVESYGSHGSTSRHLDALERIGLLEREGFSFRWRGDLPDSFGPTLEWYVAEVVRRELRSDALRAVRLSGLRGGGDYDVVALWQGRVLYVETKAGPPKAIEDVHIRSFIGRVRALAPEVALFLVDTHLRMTDKLVPMFKRELTPCGATEPAGPRPVARGVYHVRDSVFLSNTKRGVEAHLLACLWWYLRHRVGALPPAQNDIQ